MLKKCCWNKFILNITSLYCRISTNFTDCSESDFENLITGGRGLCLQNEPNEEDRYTLPSCGNNIVDEGEECDCGEVKN